MVACWFVLQQTRDLTFSSASSLKWGEQNISAWVLFTNLFPKVYTNVVFLFQSVGYVEISQVYHRPCMVYT